MKNPCEEERYIPIERDRELESLRWTASELLIRVC